MAKEERYRVIIARHEISRLTKARDNVKGNSGQYDLANLEQRLNEFAKDYDVKFTNATYTGETGKVVIYTLLESKRV